jgi:hypothetical protein
MELEQTQSVQETAAPEALAGTDNLDTLLSQFDEATGTAPTTEAPATSTTEADPARPVDTAELLQTAERERIAETGMRSTNERVDQLTGQVHAMELQRWTEAKVRLDQADFANIVNAAKQDYAEELRFQPPDFVERWLTAEALTNERLRSAFSNRHAGGGAAEVADRETTRVLKNLGAQLRTIPDRELTADRASVAHAMRGAGGGPPKSGPPNYSKLNDREFSEEKERLFG